MIASTPTPSSIRVVLDASDKPEKQAAAPQEVHDPAAKYMGLVRKERGSAVKDIIARLLDPDVNRVDYERLRTGGLTAREFMEEMKTKYGTPDHTMIAQMDVQRVNLRIEDGETLLKYNKRRRCCLRHWSAQK